MNSLLIKVTDITSVLTLYDQIKVYRDTSEGGSFTTEITGVGTRISLIPEQTIYFYSDDTGDSTHWYKTSYFHSVTEDESAKSSARQGGTEAEKIGYTFNNYAPPSGEWGKVYTADDIRYTMMFGIDCVGSDTAESEFSDEQFDQLVLEAMSEFESYLTLDIRKKVYKTFGVVSQANYTRARLWRNGVDYTDEDDPYDFDPQQWAEYGFIQLRHWPLISVERAVWYSPVKGEVMDMVDSEWLRLHKQFGQIRMFPKGGFTYGPYSVYGPLWTGMGAKRYPGAFEFDYTTGYESSDFVPDGLRACIGKYATIKALAVVGDGLLAGFSSQSISLDGLSESFSSTQSATSAYFGARIKQYSDEIKEWLIRNRYKFSPIPIGFVGAV
ncbi:MAG: hypothetical protein ACXADB_00480 [Candidatus Hermodarchaeia archaeon]|jgi:hypothetical protein